jgi:AcrR family transcriptional regulator
MVARQRRRRARRQPSDGSSKRVDRWQQQRIELITAAQRAIRKKGPRVSMEEIAAEAGITKPILYRHFGDRAGLAKAIGEAVLLFSTSEDKADMLRRMAAFYPTASDPEELMRVLRVFLAQYSAVVEMDTVLYRFLQTEQALQRMMEDPQGTRLQSPVAVALATSLRTILEQRLLDPAPAELWAHALVSLAAGAIDWWSDAKPFHRLELEKYVLELAWNGVRGVLGPPEEGSASKPRRRSKVDRSRG